LTPPRQDVIPRLETGLLARTPHAARGTLFVQPWLRWGDRRVRFDDVAGTGWRLVLAAGAEPVDDLPPVPGLQRVRFGEGGFDEADDVAARWFRRHECSAALVRPDHYVYGVAASADETRALLAELHARLT
jgi:3-(3-hydroxy-phenyl)propionate hydroxylase